jgi:hypothetical protein
VVPDGYRPSYLFPAIKMNFDNLTFHKRKFKGTGAASAGEAALASYNKKGSAEKPRSLQLRV